MSRDPVGTWAGLPLYRCRFCAYERVNDAHRIVEHEAEAHTDELRAEAEQRDAAALDAALSAAPAVVEAPVEPAPAPVQDEFSVDVDASPRRRK